MTIYDAGKTLSFNVIGYENDKGTDDYDWLMFRFKYSDGNNIAEYSDPSMTADELISLKKKMQRILNGEIQSLISKCFDDPAFSIAVIESHGEYAVAVHTVQYGNGELVHRFDVREVMSRERFELFVSEMIAETKKFPCRH